MPSGRSPSGIQPRRSRRKLGDMLVEARLINQEQLQSALKHQQVHGGRVGSILVTLGHLKEERLHSTLGRQLGVDMADVESFDPSPEVLTRIPEKLIRRYEVIPLLQRGRVMVIAATDPWNVTAMDDIRFATGAARLEIRMISEASFQRFLNTRFASRVLLTEIVEDKELDEILAFREHSAGTEVSEAPVVRLVNYLLTRSVRSRASDIHIEPFETYTRIRYRIDGQLFTVLTVPCRLHRSVISRIKVLADMDISRHRQPQDGHITTDFGDETLHFRTSTLPTVFGEKCVLRLFKKEPQLTDIARLGFSLDQLHAVRTYSQRSQGLILVTGPTGSGKTTTLHAILNDINEASINIVTIEDPVESTIPGVSHVQVSERGGVEFPSALRSILRQDPDVMMIGEVRDLEVGRIALQAALTGHLVLSTLHTNGVVETVTRLVDMGLEAYLLAGSLNMIVAQRLLRRVCPYCSSVEEVWPDLISEFGLTKEQAETAIYRRPVGCEKCFDTGYRGRVAIYETLVPSENVRRILRRGGNEQELINAIEQEGMIWMHEAAMARALAGETSFAEVRRIPV